jgi:hypothetical protein
MMMAPAPNFVTNWGRIVEVFDHSMVVPQYPSEVAPWLGELFQRR